MASTQTRSFITKAPTATVWRVWSDTSTWPNWNPDVRFVALNGPFASGTTGTMSTKQATHQIQLEDVEPGHGFSLRTPAMPLTQFIFRCEIARSESGGSVISQSLTMQGPLAVIFSPLMGNKIADTFPALLRGLATAAEREYTGGAGS